MISLKLILVCVVLPEIYGYEQVGLGSSIAALSQAPIRVRNSEFRMLTRSRRQAGGPPSTLFSSRSSGSSDSKPFIPRINPPPAGSILTYNGKAISTSIGAFSIVPKTERRTPSLNLNRPQYATYRGELPPPIPDNVPRDLPQFKNSRGVVSDFPPRFN